MKKGFGKVVACITVDVEDPDMESLLRIREICRKHSAAVTWFVDPAQCNQPQALDLLTTFVKEGDEVGLHIHWSGSSFSELRSVLPDQVETELENSLHLLESRFSVKSFRGGGLCQTTPALQILEQKGFEFDSSVAYKLNESIVWHQGHDRICPVSGYYPAQRGYDIIAYDDRQRSTILEIPVTRGIPSPNLWCNMLEPGVTPFPIMKLIFTQYFERRRFQPLVLLVLILHSWTWRKYPNALGDLDKFLNYGSNRGLQFDIIKEAGHEWKKIWEGNPELRNSLLSCRFSSDLKTLLKVESLKLALITFNVTRNPVYYLKAGVKKVSRI